MANTRKPTAKQVLAAAKLPEDTVSLCLRGDMQVAFEAAEDELQQAQRGGSDSLAGNPAAVQAARRLERLRMDMAEYTLTVRLRALPRLEFRALVDKHPPRRKPDGSLDERDKYVQVNLEAMGPALIRACAVEPADFDDADWARLLDEVLTDRQYDELFEACWTLNRREVSIPFSHAASRILQNSEPGSKPPSD